MSGPSGIYHFGPWAILQAAGIASSDRALKAPKSHSSLSCGGSRLVGPAVTPPASAEQRGPQCTREGGGDDHGATVGGEEPSARSRVRRSPARDHVGPGPPAMQVTAYFCVRQVGASGFSTAAGPHSGRGASTTARWGGATAVINGGGFLAAAATALGEPVLSGGGARPVSGLSSALPGSTLRAGAALSPGRGARRRPPPGERGEATAGTGADAGGAGADGAGGEVTLQRNITLLNGVAIIVGTIIGSHLRDAHRSVQRGGPARAGAGGWAVCGVFSIVRALLRRAGDHHHQVGRRLRLHAGGVYGSLPAFSSCGSSCSSSGPPRSTSWRSSSPPTCSSRSSPPAPSPRRLPSSWPASACVSTDRAPGHRRARGRVGVGWCAEPWSLHPWPSLHSWTIPTPRAPRPPPRSDPAVQTEGNGPNTHVRFIHSFHIPLRTPQ